MLTAIPLRFYFIAALITTLSLVSYLYIKELKHSGSIEQQLTSSQAQVASLQLNYAIKERSCVIDDQSVVQVEIEKKELEDKIGTLEEKLTKLSKQGPLIKKPNTISNNTNEAPKNAEENNVLVGTELLGDDLIQLLKQSFCNTEPTDPYCATR